MQAHIPTIFLVIITLSFALSLAIAAVSYRRKHGLMLWALGISLHGCAYLLFSLRGQISDILSIVVANTAIALMFALFTEGLQNFSTPQPRKWFIWAPVAVITISFILLLDDIFARTVISASIYLYQGGLLAYFAYRCRKEIEGRGHYVIVTASLIFSLVMILRLVGALNGTFSLSSITTSNPIQTATFLASIVSALLVVIGVMLMTWERDEQLIKEAEIRMRTLFESTSDAVMLLDERGFFDCNAATLKIFGCPSKDIFVTKTPADLSPHLQPCGTASSVLASMQIDKAKHDSSNRFEWIHKRLDNGQDFPAEVLLNSINFKGKHVLQAVVRDITERKELQRELERQARQDSLTGLDNRGHFTQRAESEVSRAARYHAPLSVLMMDIDYFKKINDAHGHHAGDEVLKQLANICRSTLRDVDVIGRIGGEEFAVVLPETTVEKAIDVAERLRVKMANERVVAEVGKVIEFTVSIGVSTLTPANEKLNELLAAADKALYAAKEAGRNRVVFIPK